MSLLDGGVAIVTGAASGIGRASALAFAREGATGVVVADVDEAGGEETAALIKESGSEAVFVRCDVSQADEVARMVQTAVDRFGGLDYAHNNAGVGPVPALVVDVTEADWDRLMGVHLKGVWLCLKHEIAVMAPHGKGAIVNTASIAGLRGAPMMSVYTAAKHGIVGLTKAVALEYAAAGIRVNTLCPGHTATPMHGQAGDGSAAVDGAPPALGRMPRTSDPSEQAEVAVWLCSDRSSYVTGAALAVDGGQTVQL